MSYPYTYPRDLSYLHDQLGPVRDLGLRLSAEADRTGRDLADLLAEADAPAEVKAALEQVWA